MGRLQYLMEVYGIGREGDVGKLGQVRINRMVRDSEMG